MLESKFLFPLNDEVCVDDVAPADYDDDRPRVGDDGVQEAGQQPAVDGGECGPTGGLHQHAVVVRELETGGQSHLVLNLLRDDSLWLVLADLQEILRHGEGPETGGDAGDPVESDGVSSSPGGPQTVGPGGLHGDQWDVVPVVGVQALEQSQGQTSSSDTRDQASRPLALQLGGELLHQAGVTRPGGGLVEGMDHEGLGMERELLVSSSISLVPVTASHYHLRTFQLKVKYHNPLFSVFSI